MSHVVVFDDLDMRQLCGRLHQVRKARGLSQRHLAWRADISVSFYNDIERGRTQGLTVHTLYTLCQVLQVRSDYLLGLTDDDTWWEEGQPMGMAAEPLETLVHRLQGRAKDTP